MVVQLARFHNRIVRATLLLGSWGVSFVGDARVAIEIERKFRVAGEGWRTADGQRYCQGYLSRERGRTVRVRVVGEQAWLTIKGETVGATRLEFEYSIPRADADELLRLCAGPLVEKVRHKIELGGVTWEVDEFLGDNAGLVVAEVELQREDQEFPRPEWLGEEVTGDPRYFNSNLAIRPYREWGTG